jgi:putative ABC transport system substrate-binding protein
MRITLGVTNRFSEHDGMILQASIYHWLLLSAALVLPAAVSHAEENPYRVYRVGFVSAQSPSTAPNGVTAFRDRLRELGYVQGQNLVIEARWAGDRYDRLPALINEVLERKVDILLVAATPAALAAMKATDKLPIVGLGLADPVRSGLVTNLARPTGNLTGLSLGFTEGIAGKWLELLQDTVPRLSTVAVLANLDNPLVGDLASELKVIAPARGLKLRVIDVRQPTALDRAFAEAARTAQGVLVLPDPIMAAHRERIAVLAAKHRLPTMYYLRDFVDAGGLMAYGPELSVISRRAGDYIDRILKGAKPSDLPVEQPREYVLIVNLKVADKLGLKIPESVLLRAGEVTR